MSASSPETDLLDLKLLPSWVKDPPVANDYSNFEGEIAETKPRKGAPHRKQGHPSRSRGAEKNRQQLGRQRARTHGRAQSEAPVMRLPAVAVRFLPRISSLQHVIAQIRSEHLAYSVFALARLFLEKPERYEVRLTATAETPFFQLGENGPISTNQRLLEASAFSWAKEEFYKIETVQSDPIKGNFSNVARCRASGTLLGPTNHHSYQLQLRNLYEQRYSRRMSFADYQRQIEIVNDPVAIEQWKEQARNVTTYTTIAAQPELTFNN